MEKLIKTADFPGAEISTIDGVRVDYRGKQSWGWGLVRPSNTTPCLVLRFEANNIKLLNQIQNDFKDWLTRNNISANAF